MTEGQEQLPGFTPVMSGGGVLTAAAEKTINDLRDKGLLDDSHELTVSIILELSRAVDRGLQFGKVTIATTTMIRELREARDSLPKVEGGQADAWAKFEAYLAAEQGAA